MGLGPTPENAHQDRYPATQVDTPTTPDGVLKIAMETADAADQLKDDGLPAEAAEARDIADYLADNAANIAAASNSAGSD